MPSVQYDMEVNQILFEALRRLMQTIPIDSLSVKDIIQCAGVSRATFYRHFKDKYDLMNQSYESILEQTLYKFYEGMKWKEAASLIYYAIKKDLSFFQNALTSSDANSLKNYIYKISMDLYIYTLEKNGENIEDWRTINLLKIWIYGSLELTTIWIQNGMKEPIDEMMEIVKIGMPLRFSRYFD